MAISPRKPFENTTGSLIMLAHEYQGYLLPKDLFTTMRLVPDEFYP